VKVWSGWRSEYSASRLYRSGSHIANPLKLQKNKEMQIIIHSLLSSKESPFHNKLHYLPDNENCRIQASVVSNRLGRWKRGFVCNHILLTTSRADVGWATATVAVSLMSIRTRSTCTVAIRGCLTAYKLELRYFPSYPRYYFPCPLKIVWPHPLLWAKRTG
jgi:hypothetical protein